MVKYGVVSLVTEGKLPTYLLSSTSVAISPS